MEYCIKYLCCCRCIYDTEEANIKKSIVKLTEVVVDSSTTASASAQAEAKTDAKTDAKTEAKTEAKSDDDDDFNIVTNEDYGDIQPSTENTINNNKIIFASSSIKDYFKKD